MIIFLWWNKRFVEHLYREICLKLLNVELQKSYLDHINTSSALVVRNFNEVKAFLVFRKFRNFICGKCYFNFNSRDFITHRIQSYIISWCSSYIFSSNFRAFTNKLIKNYGEARFFRSGEMMKTLIDILNNYKNIKIFNKSDFFTEKFKRTILFILMLIKNFK